MTAWLENVDHSLFTHDWNVFVGVCHKVFAKTKRVKDCFSHSPRHLLELDLKQLCQYCWCLWCWQSHKLTNICVTAYYVLWKSLFKISSAVGTWKSVASFLKNDYMFIWGNLLWYLHSLNKVLLKEANHFDLACLSVECAIMKYAQDLCSIQSMVMARSTVMDHWFRFTVKKVWSRSFWYAIIKVVNIYKDCFIMLMLVALFFFFFFLHNFQCSLVIL